MVGEVAVSDGGTHAEGIACHEIIIAVTDSNSLTTGFLAFDDAEISRWSPSAPVHIQSVAPFLSAGVREGLFARKRPKHRGAGPMTQCKQKVMY